MRPRLRKRWFAQLLVKAASLRCQSGRGRANPRMVKQRYSPYESHDRSLRINRKQRFEPQLLPPLALTKVRRNLMSKRC